MSKRWQGVVAVGLLALLASGCAASRAYRRGELSARAGDWDAAVAYYTRAVQSDPDRPEYRIALERAMLSASHVHLDRARELERQDQLDAALAAYRKATEYDPANRQTAARAAELDKLIRARIEAARPRPAIDQMRERARQAAAEPILNPASREPLRITFNNAGLKDILSFIGNATGINVTYDNTFQDRSYTVSLDGVTLEQALNQIFTANQLFYKVLNERTIIVIPDTAAKRLQYEEQVIRTFYLSHADATELAQLLSLIVRSPQMPVQPLIAPNKTANTITVRATAAIAAVIERVIQSNDKPRAEVVVDVEILEVNRSRAKQFGLNLTQYALGGIFSPEVAPPNTSTSPDRVAPPPPFNLNTISAGISTADFYTAVPAAIIRFLESDSQTKLIAKPNLRGTEGQKLTLHLGDEIPIASTVYTPIATGGAAVNPLTSITYKPVGVNLEMMPRVTVEGDVILELMVESSTVGRDVNVAGQLAPSFGTRRVSTKIRLTDGESTLLAGLLREDERRALRGFPGILRIPILRQLLADNDDAVSQTDIVMLLTPRIVRTHEITQQDLSPIHVGTQQNLGLTGPPPLIAPVGQAAEPPGVARPPVERIPPGSTPTPTVPPGSSPTPGMTTAPPGAQPPQAPPTPPPAEAAPVPIPPAARTPEPAPAGAPRAGPQVILTTPGTEFRVGGGPYTVPISIDGAVQLSTVSLTVTYSGGLLRIRSVQEGSFMRQGGVAVTFSQQVDAGAGRVDLALVRTADVAGASGSGLLAALLIDATSPGSTTLSVSGVATAVGGAPVTLEFAPAQVIVR